MSAQTQTNHFQEIIRGGHSIEVEVVIVWNFERDEHLGTGWTIDEAQAFDVYGIPYELEPEEIEEAKEIAATKFPKP